MLLPDKTDRAEYRTDNSLDDGKGRSENKLYCRKKRRKDDFYTLAVL